MKNINIQLLAIIIIFSLTSCNGTDVGEVNTERRIASTLVISSNVQVVQAARAGIHAGHNTATFGVKLHDLASEAGGVVNTLPGIAFIPITFDCSDRLPILFGDETDPNSATLVRDNGTGEISGDFNTCRIGEQTLHGAMTFNETAPGTQVFGLGSAAGEPLIVTEFAAPGSQVVNAEFSVSATLTFTRGAMNDTLVTSGFIDITDRRLGSRDRFDLSNVSLLVMKSAEVIGAVPYDVTTLLINGAVTRTSFLSDINPTVGHTESNTFSNYDVLFKTPAAASTAIDQFLSVNGQFSLSTSPPGRCIDGTFTVTTAVDVTIDETTGITKAGQVAVNSSGVATFTADGGISAAVSGGLPESFTREQITLLCDLGSSIGTAF